MITIHIIVQDAARAAIPMEEVARIAAEVFGGAAT
jgi:hypothetical protein